MLYELPDLDDQCVVTLAKATGDRPAAILFLAWPGPSTLRASRIALKDEDGAVEDFAKDRQFDQFCRELCKRSITRWEGIGKGGVDALLTDGNVRALLLDPKVLDELQDKFIFPILAREAEKNVSAPSSDGISSVTTEARDTAPDALPAAKNARTPSTRRKAAKAKPSGR